MEGQRFLSRKQRESLRERWFQRAGRAFEEMFGEAHQDQLVTFSEREDMACVLAKDLAAFLVEEHVAADPQVRPAAKQPPSCPKCRQAGERVTPRKEKLPERELTTRAGKVRVQREQWRCRKCRVLFFSAGPQAEAGDGGLQSAGGGTRGAAGV